MKIFLVNNVLLLVWVCTKDELINSCPSLLDIAIFGLKLTLCEDRWPFRFIDFVYRVIQQVVL